MTNWPISREAWLDLTAAGGNASLCLALIFVVAGAWWVAWTTIRRKR